VALLAGCVAAIPIAVVGVVQWRMVREAECEAAVRQAVLEHGTEHGLPPAAVERIVAGPRPTSADYGQPGYYFLKHAEIERDLAKDLALRGWSAEQIERVVQAASAALPPSVPCGAATVDRAGKDAAFIKDLAQRGRSAQEIERILRATARQTDTDRAAQAPASASADPAVMPRAH
jgi:hypothetical protein